MGVNNRGRRVDPLEQISALLDAAVEARRTLHRAAAQVAVGSLADLVEDGGPSADVVDEAVAGALAEWIGVLWQAGWQPADVAHVVRRNYPAGVHVRLTVDCMAAVLDVLDPSMVDELFSTQLSALDADPQGGSPDGFVQYHVERSGADAATVIDAVVDLLAMFSVLHQLPPLRPAPGQTASAASPGEDVDQKLLDRVRGLLAKAEASDYGPEADAFTAKAQELIARHSLDRALLGATPGPGVSEEEPGGIRIGLDSPYEAEKMSLLNEVAAANRCRAVYTRQVGLVTVLGFPADLRAVELLYASLLVQVTRAMVREGTRRTDRGGTRTRSFRQAFIRAFAVRIGQRLRNVAEAGVREAAAADDRLLPVLATRDVKVHKLTTQLFPRLTEVTGSAEVDREGWALGTHAADLATLTAIPSLDDDQAADEPADEVAPGR
jgi:hypothetical protein